MKYRDYNWLSKCFKKHSGNILKIARECGAQESTIKDWCFKYQLLESEQRPIRDTGHGKILILGGSGFVGQNLQDYLALHGYESISAPGRLSADAMDIGKLRHSIRYNSPDVVINLSAFVGGIGLNKGNPATMFYKNMQMGLNVVEACSTLGINKLIHLGSVCSYPKIPQNIPFVEGDLWNGRPEPTNEPYGVAKKTIGFMLDCYARQYGANYTYLIPTNMYGPYDDFSLHSSHVIPAMINKFTTAKENNGKVTLWGDGSPSRDFLFVEDCCEAILCAINSDIGSEPVNLGSGKETTMRFLAETIQKQVGFEGEVDWDTSKPNGQPRRVLNVDKAVDLLKFRAKTSLEDGIKKTIDWYVGNVFKSDTAGG